VVVIGSGLVLLGVSVKLFARTE